MQLLHEVRTSLLTLHRAVIAAERERFEREHGPTNAGGFLQALTTDPSLAWLKPMTQAVLEFDDLLDSKPAPTVGALDAGLSKVRDLLTPDEAGSSLGGEYSGVLDRSPDASLAHAALMQDMAKAHEGLAQQAKGNGS
ncbi:MAG: hypothetical protein QM778_31255 [Myxococcales bacterium]